MHIISTIGALLIAAILIPALYNVWDSGHTLSQQRLAADHLKMVTMAASEYVRKHDETLRSSTTASSGPSVSVPDFINENLLHQGFASHNVWGQTYQVYFRQPQADELQAIVLTTGGRTNNSAKFETVVVPSAAVLAGGSAGFVPNGDVPGQSAGTLHGAGGGWVLNLGALGISSPGPGHLGALATFDSSALGQDFLYRVAVPGHPELNAMQTELDMTGHAVRGVAELQFTEREISTESCADMEEQGRVFLDKNQGLYLCRNNRLETIGDTGNSSLLREARLAKNGDKITKPVCPANTGTTPMIFTAPSIAAADADAPPISAFQAWAVSMNDTEWQVFLRLLTSNKKLGDGSGWVYPFDDFNRISVFTTCARDTP
jgi:hypothetical protein